MQYIWIFGYLVEIGVGKNWTNNSLSGHVNFFPNLDKQNHRKTVKLELIAQNKSLNTPYVCIPEVIRIIFLRIEVNSN
jgi:hypothetical protein